MIGDTFFFTPNNKQSQFASTFFSFLKHNRGYYVGIYVCLNLCQIPPFFISTKKLVISEDMKGGEWRM